MKTRIAVLIVLLAFLILALLPPALAASTSKTAPYVAPEGFNISVFMQEKSKTLYDQNDWMIEGYGQRTAGNYAEAIKAFNKAEEMQKANQEDYYYAKDMGDIEQAKAETYAKWPGHATEAEQAGARSAKFRAMYVSLENPYTPVPPWVPVIAVIAAFLMARKRAL